MNKKYPKLNMHSHKKRLESGGNHSIDLQKTHCQQQQRPKQERKKVAGISVHILILK